MSSTSVESVLQNLSRELRELDLGHEVQRIQGPLTPLQFHRDYVSRNRPCVLTGVVSQWPALLKWHKAYVTEKLQNKKVTVAVTPNGRADAVCKLSSQDEQPCFVLPAERHILMTAFLDHLSQQHQQQHKTGSHDGASEHHGCSTDSSQQTAQQGHQEVMYIQQQNGNFTSHFPELSGDVPNSIQWANDAFNAEPDAVNMWMGNDLSVTSFHKDHYENLYAVISGEKTFTLLPPCDAFRMHLANYSVASFTDNLSGLTITRDKSSPAVLWCPIEDLAGKTCSQQYRRQYPRYFDPELQKPLRVTVRAGELLYLPSLWWHQVEQQADDEGLVIAVNYWYDMSFDCKYAYFKAVESLALHM